MSNIINFSDKRKKQVEAQTPRDEMLNSLDTVKTLIEENKLTGIVAVALGPEGKLYSVFAGEFDIIQAVGGMEAVKQMLILNSGLSEDD